VSGRGGRGPARSFFDVWSSFYDLRLVQALVYRPVQDAVVRALRARRPTSVLDVGCGTGILTTRLAGELPDVRVVGADFSEQMLGQARQRDPDLAWVTADGQRLPFRGGRFDAVVSTESFHWLPDQPAALREFRRVLAPGGTLLIAVVNPPARVFSATADRYAELAGQPAHWPTQREMRRLVTGAGFTVASQRAVFRLPASPLLPPVLTVARVPAGPG
jgi:ubiquinone/menaquinone biosynthesis C-methylase UbiE